MEHHPLKLSISRRGVYWPLPFAVVGFLTGLGVCGLFLFMVAETRDLRTIFWLIIFSYGTFGQFQQVREHLRWFGVHRRYLMGQCQACGYSLRGNISGVCPECGEKITAASRRYIARRG